MKTAEQIEMMLERILPRVTKPGRYTGGEYNQVVKNWVDIDYKVALAFPDIYDLGMSNLGLMIMYDIINKHKNLLAERVYCPWDDMEAVMRERQIPLFSLETKHPVRQFDMLAISLPYEQLYTNPQPDRSGWAAGAGRRPGCQLPAGDCWRARLLQPGTDVPVH